MAYSPPVITAAGLSIPSFNDIQQALINSYQSFYGSTTYLGNDSSDYQWISAVALKLSDNCALCQLAYNARSPLTAIGADLDGVVKINGLARLPSTPSNVTLFLVGTPGTVINNAIVQDVNGVLWQLPVGVTIGVSGSVFAVAVCQQGGAINAAPNTVRTPVGGFTAGWTSVTNPLAANVGTPVEADSNLRARQSVSVALPSSTRLAGTIAEIKAVPGVTLTNVLENQTDVTDSYGNTGHSMTAVVQGGSDLAVATAIYNNRGIGCNTLAATATTMTEIPVTDPNSGNITVIGLIRPTVRQVYVTLSIHGLTAAYNSAMQDSIKQALVTYLTSMQIGEEITQSALYGAALSAMPNLLQPDFSIREILLGFSPSPTLGNDLILNFFEVSSSALGNIVINAV
jgi:uncharacterized phage protein gp47/JayE